MKVKSISKSLLLFYILLIFSSCIEDTYNNRMSDYKGKLSKMDLKEKISFIGSGRDFLNGVQIPQFSIFDINDSIISNESIKGKLVLLNFWFIGCPSCIKEMPSLDKIHEIFKEENFEIISVCRDSETDLNEFLIDHPDSVSSCC